MMAPVLELDTAHGKEAEIAEAVIISGPNKGRIVRLRDDNSIVEDPTPEEWAMIDAALDVLLASLDRLEGEVKGATAAIKESTL